MAGVMGVPTKFFLTWLLLAAPVIRALSPESSQAKAVKLTLPDGGSQSIYADRVPQGMHLANHFGRTLLVLAAPMLADPFYADHFDAVVDFQLHFAQKILEAGDNVLILVEKEVRHYYNRVLPEDILLEASIYRGLFLRDFAPIRADRLTQFQYRPLEVAEYVWKNTTAAFATFVQQAGLNELIQHQSPLILEGDNVVDNGVDKAIISSRIRYDNKPKYREDQIDLMVTDGLGYQKVAVVSELTGESLGHSGRMVAFIEPETVAIGDLPDDEWERLMDELRKAFGNMPIVVKLRNFFDERTYAGLPAACGQYINMVVTDRAVYVPQYAGDQKNEVAGLNEQVDHKMLHRIRSHTGKRVVPVHVPYGVCRIGGSLRRMTWQIKGQQGDWLISQAAGKS